MLPFTRLARISLTGRISRRSCHHECIVTYQCSMVWAAQDLPTNQLSPGAQPPGTSESKQDRRTDAHAMLRCSQRANRAGQLQASNLSCRLAARPWESFSCASVSPRLGDLLDTFWTPSGQLTLASLLYQSIKVRKVNRSLDPSCDRQRTNTNAVPAISTRSTIAGAKEQVARRAFAQQKTEERKVPHVSCVRQTCPVHAYRKLYKVFCNNTFCTGPFFQI